MDKRGEKGSLEYVSGDCSRGQSLSVWYSRGGRRKGTKHTQQLFGNRNAPYLYCDSDYIRADTY